MYLDTNTPAGQALAGNILSHAQASGDPWTPEEARGWVAEALRGAGWVHVAPLARSDFPAETLAELAHGRRLSLDGQGLVRAPQTGPLQQDADYDPALLEHVSILKLSEEEARLLLGGVDERSLRLLQVPDGGAVIGRRPPGRLKERVRLRLGKLGRVRRAAEQHERVLLERHEYGCRSAFWASMNGLPSGS